MLQKDSATKVIKVLHHHLYLKEPQVNLQRRKRKAWLHRCPAERTGLISPSRRLFEMQTTSEPSSDPLDKRET